MKMKIFFIMAIVCFFSLLISCISDDTPEPNHISFENSTDSEIQIMKTLHTTFNPYISLNSGEVISKDVEWEDSNVQFYFIFDNVEYCAYLYPSHSRWFSIVFSEQENGEIKCTYQWENWWKIYTEDMNLKKIGE